MAGVATEDQPEKGIVICEPLTPDEWNDFLEAIGEGLRSGEIERSDVAGIIRREKELM